MYLGHGGRRDTRRTVVTRPGGEYRRLVEIHGGASTRARLRRCWELSWNFRKIKRHDPGYSIIRHRIASSLFDLPSENLQRSRGRVSARARARKKGVAYENSK